MSDYFWKDKCDKLKDDISTQATEITRLREELAAVTERMSKLDFERTAAELERDALREENARLREVLKDLIEDHEYMTDTDFEDDNLARAAARAAIREGGKDG